MKKFTIYLEICVYTSLCMIFLSFSPYDPYESEAVYIQQKLTDHYNTAYQGNKIKKYELNITNTGFCRYKRFLKNGIIEYFSFNLSKYKDMNYLGSESTGVLLLSTRGDDVIVQTYNKRGGGIDSMATSMAIPLKDIEAEDLNGLAEKFQQMSLESRK